jgi:hypothetical protein
MDFYHNLQVMDSCKSQWRQGLFGSVSIYPEVQHSSLTLGNLFNLLDDGKVE